MPLNKENKEKFVNQIKEMFKIPENWILDFFFFVYLFFDIWIFFSFHLFILLFWGYFFCCCCFCLFFSYSWRNVYNMINDFPFFLFFFLTYFRSASWEEGMVQSRPYRDRIQTAKWWRLGNQRRNRWSTKREEPSNSSWEKLMSQLPLMGLQWG